jgi:hypothetical protein
MEQFRPRCCLPPDEDAIEPARPTRKRRLILASIAKQAAKVGLVFVRVDFDPDGKNIGVVTESANLLRKVLRAMMQHAIAVWDAQRSDRDVSKITTERDGFP